MRFSKLHKFKWPIALLALVFSVFWFLSYPSIETGVVLFTAISTTLFALPNDSIQISESPHLVRSTRELFLGVIRERLIVGQLQHTLQETQPIQVMISISSGKLRDPINFDELDDCEVTDIGELFELSGRQLLILGKAGAGKTIGLLFLVDFLHKRAEKGLDQSLPIYLNLSTWQGENFQSWVTKQASMDYLNDGVNIDNGFLKSLLDQEKLILILDGLDEINETYRKKIVGELNKFRREYSGISLAVASRTEIYQELSEKLDLRLAIELVPLSQIEIERYLADVNLYGARKVIKTDPILAALVSNPFLLNVVSVAYYQMDDIALRLAEGKNDTEHRIEHILGCYVQRSIKPNTTYPSIILKRVLSWLGANMSSRNLRAINRYTFDSSWLNTKIHKRLTMFSVIVLAFLLIVMSVITAGVVLNRSISFRGGWEIAIIHAFAWYLCIALSARIFEKLPHTYHDKLSLLRLGLASFVATCAYIALYGFALYCLDKGAILGFLVTCVYSFSLYDWKLTLAVPFVTPLIIFGLLDTKLSKLLPSLIRKSLGLLLAVLAFALVLPLTIIGIAFIGLHNSYKIVTRTITKIFLAQQHSVPYNIVGMLEFATECRLLRRIGDKYYFRHQYLQDYFASQRSI